MEILLEWGLRISPESVRRPELTRVGYTLMKIISLVLFIGGVGPNTKPGIQQLCRKLGATGLNWLMLGFSRPFIGWFRQ